MKVCDKTAMGCISKGRREKKTVNYSTRLRSAVPLLYPETHHFGSARFRNLLN